MKDTYRERIKEEQKKLSPSQVFFSEGYRKLFRDLANEVAGEKLEQLLLYQSTEDGLAGWNDGKRIGINIGNLITGSFLELEQKKVLNLKNIVKVNHISMIQHNIQGILLF